MNCLVLRGSERVFLLTQWKVVYWYEITVDNQSPEFRIKVDSGLSFCCIMHRIEMARMEQVERNETSQSFTSLNISGIETVLTKYSLLSLLLQFNGNPKCITVVKMCYTLVINIFYNIRFYLLLLNYAFFAIHPRTTVFCLFTGSVATDIKKACHTVN